MNCKKSLRELFCERELKAKGFRELRLTARELNCFFSKEIRCGKIINNSLTQGIALQFTNAMRSIHGFSQFTRCIATQFTTLVYLQFTKSNAFESARELLFPKEIRCGKIYK